MKGAMAKLLPFPLMSIAIGVMWLLLTGFSSGHGHDAQFGHQRYDNGIVVIFGKDELSLAMIRLSSKSTRVSNTNSRLASNGSSC